MDFFNYLFKQELILYYFTYVIEIKGFCELKSGDLLNFSGPSLTEPDTFILFLIFLINLSVFCSVFSFLLDLIRFETV